MKTSVIGIAVALMISLDIASDAAAKKRHPNSAIAVESVGPDAVTGRISSDDRTCRAQREVTLYRVNSGPSVPSGEFVAIAWTHGDGSWSVPGPLFPSEFYAVTERKSAKGTACRPATSNYLSWG